MEKQDTFLETVFINFVCFPLSFTKDMEKEWRILGLLVCFFWFIPAMFVSTPFIIIGFLIEMFKDV